AERGRRLRLEAIGGHSRGGLELECHAIVSGMLSGPHRGQLPTARGAAAGPAAADEWPVGGLRCTRFGAPAATGRRGRRRGWARSASVCRALGRHTSTRRKQQRDSDQDRRSLQGNHRVSPFGSLPLSVDPLADLLLPAQQRRGEGRYWYFCPGPWGPPCCHTVNREPANPCDRTAWDTAPCRAGR